MRISIVGTGNMAQYIGERIQFKGYEFEEVVGRDQERLVSFTNKYGGHPCTSVAALSTMVDILIIAVKDDAIESCTASLNGVCAKMIIHCSGTQSINLLGDLFEAKAVVWPIYSLSKFRHSPYPNKVPLAIEWSGPDSYKDILNDFLALLSDQIYYIDEKERALLHLAAVFTNNHIHHLMVLMEEFCAQNAIPFDALKPIIHQTTSQVEKKPLRPLQTGPAIRKDINTLNHHQELLVDHPQLLAIYQLFMQSIQN